MNMIIITHVLHVLQLQIEFTCEQTAVVLPAKARRYSYSRLDVLVYV